MWVPNSNLPSLLIGQIQVAFSLQPSTKSRAALKAVDDGEALSEFCCQCSLMSCRLSLSGDLQPFLWLPIPAISLPIDVTMSDHNLSPRQSVTHFFAPKKKRLSPLFSFP